MPGYRPERIAELMHEELARRLLLDVKDPRLTPISITRVDVTRDLRRATVSYLPLGGGEPTEELREALDRAGRQLRGPIGRAMRLRHAPEIAFEPDKNLEQAIRVTHLIEKIRRERADSDPADEVDPDAETESSE